jgi:hypothetical protein
VKFNYRLAVYITSYTAFLIYSKKSTSKNKQTYNKKSCYRLVHPSVLLQQMPNHYACAQKRYEDIDRDNRWIIRANPLQEIRKHDFRRRREEESCVFDRNSFKSRADKKSSDLVGSLQKWYELCSSFWLFVERKWVKAEFVDSCTFLGLSLRREREQRLFL